MITPGIHTVSVCLDAISMKATESICLDMTLGNHYDAAARIHKVIAKHKEQMA